MDDTFSPFGAPEWKEEATEEQIRRFRSKLLAWCAERPALLALVASAAGFVLIFLSYCTQFGRAFYFAIPITEIPPAETLETILIMIAAAVILLATNSVSYREVKYQKCTHILKQLVKWCVFLFILVFIIFVLYVLITAIINAPINTLIAPQNAENGQSDSWIEPLPGLLGALVLLALLIWILVFGMGAIFGLSERRSPLSVRCYEKDSPQKTAPSNNAGIIRNKIGRQALRYGLALAILSCGFVAIGFIAPQYPGAPATIAVVDNETEEKQTWLVVFSDKDRVCVEECDLSDSSLLKVDTSHFLWMDKSDLVFYPISTPRITVELPSDNEVNPDSSANQN